MENHHQFILTPHIESDIVELMCNQDDLGRDAILFGAVHPS